MNFRYADLSAVHRRCSADAATAKPSGRKGGKRTFAAVAKAVRPHRGSGHSSENQGRNLPDRHKGREAEVRRGRKRMFCSISKRSLVQ